MKDTAPQTAGGKVLWHFSMSLDGFIAAPNHGMDWLTGFDGREGLIKEYVESTGAVLGGRDGWEAFPDAAMTYGGAWSGPTFVLTHHSDEIVQGSGATFLSCGVEEAVRIGLEAANGKNLEILSASIGRQLLQLGLIDEIDLHIAPVLLGDGIRLYDNPGGRPIPLDRYDLDGKTSYEVNVRYRPRRTESS